MSTFKLPGFNFDGLRKGAKVYLSATDIAAHLEESAKAADLIDEEDIARVLRLYRTAVIEAVAALS